MKLLGLKAHGHLIMRNAFSLSLRILTVLIFNIFYKTKTKFNSKPKVSFETQGKFLVVGPVKKGYLFPRYNDID